MNVLRSPPVQTIAFLGGVGVVFLALGLGEGTSAGTPPPDEWLIWKATASLGIATAAVLAFYGQQRVRQEKDSQRLSGIALAGYLAAGLVVLAGVLGSIEAVAVSHWEWPINSMGWRLTAVTWAIGIAGIPWITLVWLALARLRLPLAKDQKELSALQKTWDLLTSCVFAFMTFVVIAIVTTGALRALWVEYLSSEDSPAPEGDFPESYVLLYGLYFSVLMAAVTVPLVLAYRKRVKEVVDSRYPLPEDARISQDWLDSRTRLEGVLHYSVTIIRTPIAIFAVFTPLITSALATLVPALGA